MILIWFAATYNRFQEYKIRINEAEVDIDATLRKRYDLLNKSIGVIKANIDKKDVLKELADIRSQKVSNFELDRIIYNAINEITTLKEEYKDLRKCEAFMKIELGVNETEAEIVAARKYYNDIVTDYNKLAKSFPSCLVKFICGFKTKEYYDGKNLDKKSDIKI